MQQHASAAAAAAAQPVPLRAVSAVEHPCIVKNIDKGITSLGGPVKLSRGLRSSQQSSASNEAADELKKLISVSLRPDDPFAKRLLSAPVTTSNLLLKVTVPKPTGRKRKRGSTGPFLAGDESRAAGGHISDAKTNTHVKAAQVYRSLRDNAARYEVVPAGIINETHRFRAMPDLQYAAAHNDTMVGIRDHLLPMRYREMKKYTLNTAAGADLTKGVGPSAEFLQMPIAFNYRFQQNAYVKYTDQGEVNLQRRLAYNGYVLLKPTDATVPMGPKDTLPPESSLTPYLQTLINQIKALLKERPIITRHMLYNKLGWDKRTRLRQAAVYCGYFFESGPWREALVKWGVDPRTDPQYRIYQTVSFLSYKKRGTARHFTEFDKHVQQLSRMTTEQLENKHTFDGVHASDTGNTFQFCDITDPLIAKILATNDVRTTCAPTFQGWYHVGTWAKATVILKDKMNAIIGGERPDNSIYERVTKWPELWDDQEIYATYRDEVNDREVHQEKRKEHDVMHNVRFAARNPRYAFEKMEKNDEGGRQVGETEGPEVEEVPEDLTEYPETAATIINEGDGGDDDDDSSEDGDDDDEDEDVDAGEGEDEDRNELEDADGIWEEDDDQPIATETQTAGPAPFGGLYRM